MSRRTIPDLQIKIIKTAFIALQRNDCNTDFHTAGKRDSNTECMRRVMVNIYTLS